MYIPPQLDGDTSSHPQTYLFSPVGIGRKEKREQWIWKGEIKESTRPQPFSYEYVIEDGKLPTITVHHPPNATNSAPAQRKLSKRTRPPGLERHSSPASPGYSPPPVSPRSNSTAGTSTKLKRALSLASLRVQRSSYEESQEKPQDKKPLPPLPRIESIILTDAMRPTFERSFFDASEADVEQSPWPVIEIPPRSPRRLSVTNPVNATPRIPKAPQIAPQSFDGKDDIISPITLKKDSPKQVTPIQIPQPSPMPVGGPRKLSLDTRRPTLQRQKSKFVEHIDSPRPSTDLPLQGKPQAPVMRPALPEKAVSRLPPNAKVSFEQPKATKKAEAQKYTRTRQLSLSTNATPQIAGAPTPRRAATVRTPTSAQSARSLWADGVCMAEARPLHISPIVATGTAKLVSC